MPLPSPRMRLEWLLVPLESMLVVWKASYRRVSYACGHARYQTGGRVSRGRSMSAGFPQTYLQTGGGCALLPIAPPDLFRSPRGGIH